MRLSRRSEVDFSENSWTRALRHASSRGPLLDLTASNPTAVGLPFDDGALSRALGVAVDGYSTEPRGLPEARTALTEELASRGVEVPIERCLLTAGTSEAYAHLFSLLADPGDEILVPTPSYPLLEHLARLSGVRLRSYPLVEEGTGFVLDTVALRRAVTPGTRAVVAVSPHNPTGHRLASSELDALGALGLPCIVDEVFLDYAPLSPRPDRPPPVVRGDGLWFSLGGLSKQCALPQLKLSWVLVSGDAPLAAEALSRLELALDTFLCVSTPVQRALPALLALGRERQRLVRGRTHRCWEALRRLCAGSAVTPRAPAGGWSALLRLPSVLSDQEWALTLLERDGVVVQPGWLFDLSGCHLVVSLLTPEEVFEVGLSRLVARVERSL